MFGLWEPFGPQVVFCCVIYCEVGAADSRSRSALYNQSSVCSRLHGQCGSRYITHTARDRDVQRQEAKVIEDRANGIGDGVGADGVC